MKTRYAAEQHFEDFWKIIQTHVLHRFKHNKLSYADYQKMGTIERANKFSLPNGLLERMGRFIDESGTYQRHAMQFIHRLEEDGKVVYHSKVSRVYSNSGKRFDLPPWIEITSSQLQILLVLDREGKFELTERQMKLVKRYFPNGPKEERPRKAKPRKAEKKPEPVKSFIDYGEANGEVHRALRAMKDANTVEELDSAKFRCLEILDSCASRFPDMFKRERPNVDYYVRAFESRNGK